MISTAATAPTPKCQHNPIASDLVFSIIIIIIIGCPPAIFANFETPYYKFDRNTDFIKSSISFSNWTRSDENSRTITTMTVCRNSEQNTIIIDFNTHGSIFCVILYILILFLNLPVCCCVRKEKIIYTPPKTSEAAWS